MEEYIIYIQNIPQEVTEEDLKSFFQEYRHQFIRVNLTSSLKRPSSENSKIAFLHTLDKGVFEKIMKMNGVMLNDVPITIQKGRNSSIQKTAKFPNKCFYSLRICNIPKDIVRKDISALFKNCGTIHDINLLPAHSIAYLDFVERGSLRKALQIPMEDRQLNGTPINYVITKSTLEKIHREEERDARNAKPAGDPSCFVYSSDCSKSSNVLDFCSPAARFRFLQKVCSNAEIYLKRHKYKADPFSHKKPDLLQLLKKKSKEKQNLNDSYLLRKYDYLSFKPLGTKDPVEISAEELKDLKDDIAQNEYKGAIPLAIKAKDIYRPTDANNKRRLENVFSLVRERCLDDSDYELSDTELFDHSTVKCISNELTDSCFIED